MISVASLDFLWCVNCVSSSDAIAATFSNGVHAMHSNSSHHHHHNSTSNQPYHHAHGSSLSPLMKTVILLSVYAILAASILLICCWHIQVQEAGKRYYYARIDDPSRSRLPSGGKDATLPPLPTSSKKRSSSRQYQTDDSSDEDDDNDFTSDVERGIALHDYHSTARSAMVSANAARAQRDPLALGRVGGLIGDADSNRPPLHPPFGTPTTGPPSSRQHLPLDLDDHRANGAAPIATPRKPVDDTSLSGDAEDLLGDTDGDDRSTLSARDTRALESLIDGYVSDIDSFLRQRDDFYAPGYAYNIDRLRQQLPPPPALLRQLQRFRSAAAGEHAGAKPLTGTAAAVGDKSPGEQKKPTRGAARRTMSRAEYVRFLRAQSDVLAVSANQASVSLVRLTPYRGEETVHGKFRCVNVGCRVDMVEWESDASICDGAERCPRCSRWVYPYEQHERSDEADD